MSTTKYPHLYSYGKIGKLALKNRIVMSPMGTFSENHDGSVSSNQLEYFRARARGGVGMVITEVQYVTNKTDPWINYITTADTDEQMKGWSTLVEAIHAEGAKVCIQLGCGLGRNAFPFSDDQMVSASEVPSFYFPDRLCRAFTVEEIHDIVGCFTRAAARAKLVGADAVEIHAHAGYILDQFITPIWNKRTDEYGGSFENRMRICKEIYEGIRSQVGPDMPILMRVAATHDFKGGRTLEESIEVVNYMKNLGVDAFDIDVGAYEDKQWVCPSIYQGDSSMADYAAKIKKACGVIVLNSGTHTPASAEKALAEGKIDFAMFGRALIADPDMPNKILEGHEEDVRPCLFCNQICVGRLYENRSISCAINPQAVHELEYPLKKTEHPKKVAVIGAGPGGLEAARVAAAQGHDVTLYDKSDVLGGQLVAAATPSFKKHLREFVEYEKVQIKKNGVKVVLGKEITPDSPELAEADRIILALGAVPAIPNIPGIHGENVVEVCDSHLHPEKVRGNKIVVAGGGVSGCEAALDLAYEGKDVTIVEMLPELCPTALLDNRNPLLFRLRDNHVKQLTSTKIKEFTKDGVLVEGPEGEKKIEADTVIVSFGMKPNNGLVEAICEKYPTTAVVGDCIKVGQVCDAVRGGFFAAWSIH
ncbi:MAG: FAD-dependent oxidoreductase [Erysipelotrichales bacterium]|nr:FAD-dependent oxidoreductase [Erysipelotrichales bacterium]